MSAIHLKFVPVSFEIARQFLGAPDGYEQRPAFALSKTAPLCFHPDLKDMDKWRVSHRATGLAFPAKFESLAVAADCAHAVASTIDWSKLQRSNVPLKPTGFTEEMRAAVRVAFRTFLEAA